MICLHFEESIENNNVFKEEELEKENNTQKMHVNNVRKPVPFYSLDVIATMRFRIDPAHYGYYRNNFW